MLQHFDHGDHIEGPVGELERRHRLGVKRNIAWMVLGVHGQTVQLDIDGIDLLEPRRHRIGVFAGGAPDVQQAPAGQGAQRTHGLQPPPDVARTARRTV